MRQKIIKVGNSAAVTIPKKFLKEAGWKTGSSVIIDGDSQMGILMIKDVSSPYKTSITPEFKDWLDEIGKKYGKTIKALAKV